MKFGETAWQSCVAIASFCVKWAMILSAQHEAVRQGAKAARSGHGLRWLMSFGAVGLFVVSAIDSSIIPLPVPGSTDLLLILLIAHGGDPVFGAAAAIVGSILGGYLTWATGARGGEAALHRHLPKRFGKRLSGWVEKSGTAAVTGAALLPPPFPLMPLLLAAGALGVSRKRFLISFSVARTFRYALVAWLAATYGRTVDRVFRHYLSGWSTTIMWIYLGLMAAGILYGVWKFRHQRRQSPAPRTAALSTKQGRIQGHAS
jgi:membrane protein YqaA with SNARE-associated domain